ncbi:MAG TPA: NAD-glutamate dehydrogenase, partial [Beijerinckiaceae bacterium]|nr:NAD-glutamate dehydrogenase [Beijerinckiaceae bacterium]
MARSADKGRSSAEALLAASFESLLFGRVVSEDLVACPPDSLSAIAASAFDRFVRRRPGEVDVRLVDVTLADGRAITIVETVNDDMPFLLDSTLAELGERGLDIHLVAHPILAVKRDAKGALVALQGIAGAAETGDFLRESLIHIHVGAVLDAGQRAGIVAALERIHQDVHAAVRDWRAMRERLAAVARRYREAPPLLPADEIAEAVQFLDWLLAENFTFLGLREYRFPSLDDASEPVAGEGLGILADPEVKVLRRGAEMVVMTAEVRAFLKEKSALIIAKANVKSRVHRRVHMDYVGVKLIGPLGQVEGELRLIGLFTSTAYTSSTRVIPYIRHKVAMVMARAGFDPASHSGKALANVLENYPRDELFQLDRETLYGFAMDALSLIERPRIRAMIRVDRFDRFVSVIVYVPKDRYDTAVRTRIGNYLAGRFEGRISAAYPSYPEGPLARTHYIIGRYEGQTPLVNRADVEEAIAEICRTWPDKLRRTLAEGERPERAVHLFARYGEAFGAAYREAFTPSESLKDMQILESLRLEAPVAVDFYRKGGQSGAVASLKFFALGAPMPLSQRVPMLENLGFAVNNERTYRVAGRDGGAERTAFLHDMTIERARGGDIDVQTLDTRVEDTLMALVRGEAESDRFNALVVDAGLTWRQALLLRAYARYLQQIGAPFGQEYIAGVLGRYPDIAGSLVALFEARFDPAAGATPEAGTALTGEIGARLDGLFEAVSSLDDDRIVRRTRNLIEATLRTNFYQTPDGGHRPTLAFKFEARRVEGLPLPRPLYEIFVHSARVDGVHMRFGKVARGGLRWSDRPMDFRTEVLGLVKAQQVKNAVIVPVGAKGGFFPKRLPPASERDAWFKEGTEAYKIFIGALLDLTDTLDGDAVRPPPQTVRHDGDDPYLVVAADKGTATFSDTANAISLARGHWLGDAFASGGSVGYDHKKMGITARGAWECVKRHFREIDADIQTQPFTVAGVGDMSGDVFGNGMLLSPAIRLVAAFDHRDIFIDPDPDPTLALAERQRLFALPRSSWQDYDRAKISRGGGVFSRSAKEIVLSEEARRAIGLDQAKATPQEVLSAILKAPVDLLWFGGIGTYIRASDETDAQVGDRANDAIRIPAVALRCKVVGEGANLGCTQRGRIEAARRGIRLNTDAIDNSAGVNTSDVEVNLKIALSRPLSDGRLSEGDRNALLASLTDEVARIVLRNNYLQSLALTLAERQGAIGLTQLQRLMQGLEARGRLDRSVEVLPADPEIARRLGAGEGATRPELAVLLAYAKLSAFEDLIASKVPDDPYFADELDRYFPDEIRRRFPDAVTEHRLRREIIATQLSNIVVNRCGPGAMARFADETGADVPTIALAYAATRDSFGLLDLNGAIDLLDARLPGAVQVALYAAVQDVLVGRMAWFLRNTDLTSGLGPLVARFRQGVEAARLAVATALPAEFARERDRHGFRPQINSWMVHDAAFSRRCAEAGFVGMTLSAEYGGRGRTPLERHI